MFGPEWRRVDWQSTDASRRDAFTIPLPDGNTGTVSVDYEWRHQVDGIMLNMDRNGGNIMQIQVKYDLPTHIWYYRIISYTPEVFPQ